MSARSSPRPTGRMRRAPLTRSSSLLGTLKSLVAAPLTWFGSNDDVHDTPGEKRPRRLQVKETDHHQDVEEDGEHRSKRKRIHSPEPEAQRPQPTQHYKPDRSGYLDPPQSLLKAPLLQGNASASYTRSSTAAPTISGRYHPYTRLSLSPRPSTSHGKPAGIARTQSMDPPGRLLVPSKSRPPPLSRDASLMSIDEPLSSPIGDVSMSPTRPRFRLRTSLTPQPTGSDFGPTPMRRERDPSEAPPLEALMENPVFVKAPTNAEPATRHASLTLGSLAETHKAAQPLTRQRSNLMIGPQSSSLTETSNNKSSARPVNAAEIALHELEVYRTPLLPSRMRGSAAIPDMFRPKKNPHAPPLLMRGDRDERPRLGTSDSEGAKKSKGTKDELGKGAKPYSGQGGMKKLLARRRMEEEEEKEKEKEAAIVTDDDGEEVKNMDKVKAGLEKKLVKDLEAPLVARAPEPPAMLGGRPQSSLRVGRTRTSRNHAPAAKPKSKNKFSAIYEDDEADDFMAGEEAESKAANAASESATPTPMYEAPKGFSFASNAAPVQQDAAKAKEPPISTLPFSLTKAPMSTPTTSVPSTPAPATVTTKTDRAASADAAKPTPAASPLPTLPSIALIPPSPGPSAAEKEEKEKSVDQPSTSGSSTSSGSSSIPNFFANSAIFSKPSAQLPFALTPSTSASTPATKLVVSGGPSSFSFSEKKSEEAAPTTATLAPSLFGNIAETTKAAAPLLLFGAPSTGATTADSTSTAFFGPPSKQSLTSSASSSLFGTTAGSNTSAASLFGGASTSNSNKDATLKPAFSFSESPRPAETPATAAPANPFSFGAPTKSTEAAAPAVSLSFFFGQPKAETKPATGTSDTSKSTTTSPPLFTGFGAPVAPAAAAPSPVEPSKPAFTFGQPAPTTANTTTTPSIEAPKPLFGSAPPAGPSSPFSFGTSSSVPLPDAPTPVKSPFTFGASAPSTPAPPTTAAGERKSSPFLFGASSPAASQTSAPVIFGTPSSGSNGADVSKGFAFGTSTPARPLTPPQRNDTEVNMDESPTRGGGMDLNGNGKASEMKPPSSFSFGNGASGASSPFGQTTSASSPFGFGASGSTSNPFGAKQEAKPAEKPALSFGSFGQQSSSTSGPFAFGNSNTIQTTPASTAPSTGAFSFGATSSAPTSNTFSFGAPAPTASNPFGQPAPATGSAPASPAFNQPAPFSFGAASVTPTSAPSNPFQFGGSQPASPASANAGLPPVSSSGFSFGQSSAAPPASSPSPFGAPAPLPSTGGALFTMGSAPPAPSAGAGGRPLKKLPSRRGGKR